MGDIKYNCYQGSFTVKSPRSSGRRLSPFGSSFPFNPIINRLLWVVSNFIIIGFFGCLVCRRICFCIGCRLEGWSHVFWSRVKKAKLIIAHNYKKCDKPCLMVNKINGLWIEYFQKSVIQFKLSRDPGGVQGSQTHTPLETFQRFCWLSSLLLFINCSDFLRVFYEGIGQRFVLVDVFVFKKWGARGEYGKLHRGAGAYD